MKTLLHDELSKRKKRGNWKMKHSHQNVCLNENFIVKRVERRRTKRAKNGKIVQFIMCVYEWLHDYLKG